MCTIARWLRDQAAAREAAEQLKQGLKAASGGDAGGRDGGDSRLPDDQEMQQQLIAMPGMRGMRVIWW